MSQKKRPTRRDFLKTAGARSRVRRPVHHHLVGAGQQRTAGRQRPHRDGRDRHRQHGPRRSVGLPQSQGRAVRGHVRRARRSPRRGRRRRSTGTTATTTARPTTISASCWRGTDIDAVHIATPDHWHAIITIEACRNGKDVFCQKPETLTLREGPLMIAAARRYGRVVSGGSQRVLEDYRKYVDPAWAGEFGKIKSINVNVGPLPKLCNLPPEEMTEKIDWDMWLGPAPWGPYNSKRCSGSYSINGVELAFVQRLFGRRHDRLGRPSLRRRDLHLRRARAAARGSDLSRRQGGPLPRLPLSQRPDPLPQPAEHAQTCRSKGRPGEKLPPKPVPTYKGGRQHRWPTSFTA